MTIRPVLDALEAVGAPYALIGGRAMAARGYPRFTVDVDLLTVDRAVLNAEAWTVLEGQGARVERRRGDDEDPLAGVVHILLADGTDVDVVIARWAWAAALIARAEPLTVVEGVAIPVPRTSDLILLKLAAGGFVDVADAAALLEIGDRASVVREVESRIGDMDRDIGALWRQLIDS